MAAVHLWALPLEVTYTTPSSSWDPAAPSAVRSEVRGRYVLQATSPGAQQLGIRPGATQSEARARRPDLAIRDRDRGAEQRELERVAELLFAFGPVVEVCGPNLLFVEVGRSRRALTRRLGKDYTETSLAQAILHTLSEAGHLASVTICGDPETGRTLVQHLSRGLMPQGPSARRLRGRGRSRGVTQKAGPGSRRARHRWEAVDARVQVVPPGQEARALSGLPVHALTWTDERRDPDGHLRERLVSAASSLRVLGVIDVGRLQAMPSAQIASRFGDAGHLLMARTRGQTARPLRLFTPPARLVERAELEHVTEDLEPVLFILRGLLDRLAARLDARALSVGQVSLTFTVEPGLGHEVALDAHRPRSSRREETIALRLARPSRKAKTLFALAQDRLDQALPGAVWALQVEAVAPHADHGAQLDLFTAHEKRLEAVGELVGRLRATLGDDAVFSPRMRDTHRPEAAWTRGPFDIDAALRPAPVTKPRVVEMTAIEGQGESQTKGAPLYALPEVGEGLSVTGAAVPQVTAFCEAPTAQDPAAGASADPAKARPWPKPVPREPADEPAPPLSARPTVLFSRPERATLLRSAGGLDEGVLVWRGERHHLVRLSAFERLQTEWWSSAPLERDYAVAEAGDGRRFWVFFTPQASDAETRGAGEAYVHGIFD